MTKVSKQPRKVLINRVFFTFFEILEITRDYWLLLNITAKTLIK